MSIIKKHRPRVVVIGGGATGTGIARQAAEQGMEVVLVERGELGSGTSSHFHGMLHSGARYAVADPAVAAACYQENQRLRQLIPSAISDTGGLFIALNEREAAHAELILAACRQAGIPTQEISRTQALRREPRLNPSLQRAFSVPDGFIDGAKLLQLNYQAAESASGPVTFMTGQQVIGLRQHAGVITTVQTRSVTNNATHDIDCDYVINAAGVWAGRVAELAGIDVPMIFDKGTMIVFKDQLTDAVINRCRPENDGDLLVSHTGTSIMGTTSRIITDPDDCLPSQEEADVLVREGAQLVPALGRSEALRIYAGVRPLHAEGTFKAGRGVSRSFQVLDHAEQGVDNFISVVGGKITLFQLMAEAAVNVICDKSGYKARKRSG